MIFNCKKRYCCFLRFFFGENPRRCGLITTFHDFCCNDLHFCLLVEKSRVFWWKKIFSIGRQHKNALDIKPFLPLKRFFTFFGSFLYFQYSYACYRKYVDTVCKFSLPKISKFFVWILFFQNIWWTIVFERNSGAF